MATYEQRPDNWSGTLFDPSTVSRMRGYLDEIDRMNKRIRDLKFEYVYGFHTFSFTISPEERNEWTDMLLEVLKKLVATVECEYRHGYCLWTRGASSDIGAKIHDEEAIIVTITG